MSMIKRTVEEINNQMDAISHRKYGKAFEDLDEWQQREVRFAASLVRAHENHVARDPNPREF